MSCCVFGGQDPERRSLPCLTLLRTIIIPFFQTSDQARFLRLFTNLLSGGNSDLNEDKILIGRLFTSLEQLRADRRAGTVEARSRPSESFRGGEKNKHQHEQNAIHDHRSPEHYQTMHPSTRKTRGHNRTVGTTIELRNPKPPNL